LTLVLPTIAKSVRPLESRDSDTLQDPLPLFVSVVSSVLALPTLTLPKARLSGPAERLQACCCSSPVPDRLTSTEGVSGSLLATLSVALCVPAVSGR